MPRTHIIETDPNLWVPPYEPPQGFFCIADPPDSYADAHGRVRGGQEPKKPVPEPKPAPKPPQPRDGYEVEINLADATPDIKKDHAWSLGGQEPKKPAPKPVPPQPRDGYAISSTPTFLITQCQSKASLILSLQGVD